MADARFEDGAEVALSLKAESADDLAILSALVQDAVLSGGDLRWDRRGRTFALLLSRFRWEDRDAAEREARPFERTRALLVIGGVTGVFRQGLGRLGSDVILSLLSLQWEQGPDGAGRVVLTLAGAAQIAVAVECLDVALRDVTRPYAAPSGRTPLHPD